MENSDMIGNDGITLLPAKGEQLNLQAASEPELPYPSDSAEVAVIVSLCLVIPILFVLYWKRLAIARFWLGIEGDSTNLPFDTDQNDIQPTAIRLNSRSSSPDGTLQPGGYNELPIGKGGRRRTDVRVMEIIAPAGVRCVQLKDLTAITKNFGFSETGEVYVARWSHDGVFTQVLAKELTPAKEKQAIRWRTIFQEQLDTLAKISHANILKLLAFAEGDKPCQVMEYPAFGCLNVYLGKARVVSLNEPKEEMHHLSRQDMLTMALDACRAVAYLASQEIVHSDLAARHCFVTDERRVKLSCHELSQQSLQWEYEVLNERAVAVRWSAPEILSQSLPPTRQTDIWSLGVLMWEIFSKGKKPFSSMSMDEVISNVISGSVHKQPEFANEAIYAVMVKCWKTAPHERPPAADLVKELENLFSCLDTTHACSSSHEYLGASSQPGSVRSTGALQSSV